MSKNKKTASKGVIAIPPKAGEAICINHRLSMKQIASVVPSLQ